MSDHYDRYNGMESLLSTNLAGVGTDSISRQDAIDAVMKCYDNDELFEVYEDTLRALPSAQPSYNPDEWCHDCKEYDTEKHCCPRWNKVIRSTLQDVKQSDWIPCSERLPKKEGFYLVTLKYKRGAETTIRFFRIENGECYWSKWGNEIITAWQPLPEPYREEKE